MNLSIRRFFIKFEIIKMIGTIIMCFLYLRLDDESAGNWGVSVGF